MDLLCTDELHKRIPDAFADVTIVIYDTTKCRHTKGMLQIISQFFIIFSEDTYNSQTLFRRCQILKRECDVKLESAGLAQAKQASLVDRLQVSF